jgi:pyrroloquinoline quinone biosynthesis protein B
MLRALVIGSAAGGGFPQWNSNQPGCNRARRGDASVKARTQASLAVTGNGRDWFLFNASPDLRQQINDNPALWPAEGLRSSPIKGVVITGGDIDVIAGLLTLRERQPLVLSATARVHQVLRDNPVFGVLAEDLVRRDVVALDHPFALATPEGRPAGLTVTLFAVPGKIPLYLEASAEGSLVREGEDTVGAHVTDGRHSLFFIPGCSRMTAALKQRLYGADVVLFDGTLWQDDEMIAAGVGAKTGQRMGHISVSGPDGTIAAFADLAVKRKILIHINNTNPILQDDSAQAAFTRESGWEVSYDGMVIDL